MAKRKEPLYKKFSEWWPVFAGVVALVGWITTQAVRGAQDEAKIAEHEKKIEDGDVKDKEQDQEMSKQMIQNQLIQQDLSYLKESQKQILEEVKKRR